MIDCVEQFCAWGWGVTGGSSDPGVGWGSAGLTGGSSDPGWGSAGLTGGSSDLGVGWGSAGLTGGSSDVGGGSAGLVGGQLRSGRGLGVCWHCPAPRRGLGVRALAVTDPGPPAAEASRQVVCLSEELARKAEDTARQQEEISQLLAQVVDLQQKCRVVSIPCPRRGVPGGRGAQLPDLPRSCPQYGSEVEELQQHLAVAKEVQQQLRTEVSPGRVGGPALLPPGPCLSCARARSCGTCRRSTPSAAGCCRKPRRR